MDNQYINPGDLVWVQNEGQIVPLRMRTTGLVLECLHSPNKYWYKIMMTYGNTPKIVQFPLSMLIKIEEDFE